MYLDVSDMGADLWRKNPQLKTLTLAKRLYDNEGEKWFNRVYYAIYLVNDPLSPMRKNTTDTKQLRKDVKASYFYEEEDFAKMNWQTLRPVISEYKIKSITKESKRFSRLELKIQEADTLIDKFKMEELEDIDRVAKAMDSFVRINSSFIKAKKEAMDANKEGSGSKFGSTHGNLSDKR